MRRRVVITGMGGMSAIGGNCDEMWQNARAGVCGIAPITQYDTTGLKVTLAGEVKGFDPEAIFGKKESRKMARFTQFAVAAAREAFQQSGLDMTKEDAARCGVEISSGIGGLDIIEREHDRGLARGFDRVSPNFIPLAISNLAAGMTAIDLGFHGGCTCVVSACASSTNAVGEAFRQIRDGYQDVIAAGGTEACITDLGVGGFTSMRALTTATDPDRASIPFDKERSGFVMGEGAGVLILEERNHAIERGATIIAEVVGYGVTCDAYHMTAPLEDGSEAARSMEEAIRDARIQPEEIGYINAHGTSTQMNDRCETAAVKKCFGSHAQELVMSSTKSMTGHLLGASGAVEAMLTALALKDQIAPPTANYREPDPDCDLNICPNEAQAIQTEYAMSNSFGFGGHNASIILKKSEV